MAEVKDVADHPLEPGERYHSGISCVPGENTT
jgi:hypothetical protein